MSAGSIERCYVFKNRYLKFAGHFIIMEVPDWFKIKGYYHISPQLSSDNSTLLKTIQKIKNKQFVEKYAFFPLLHVNIKERKYKKHPSIEGKRVHSFEKNGKIEKTVKLRPLHYANHFDALIYSYYAHILQNLYENNLTAITGLSDCVTAYRKIQIAGSDKNKGTIHFADDAFSEIKKRTLQSNESAVLAFDIKSFFSSLDHKYLYNKWKDLLNSEELPKDHLNVFNSATNFSFIYKDDLRKNKNTGTKKGYFDEKKLASIRNTNGFKAFFQSPKEFREQIKNGKLRIYKNCFKDSKTKKMIGIPQGLPISALLANLYLFDFDKAILSILVNKNDCFYRRYSDDIVIICDKNQIEKVERLVISEMNKCRVKISEEKTEKFIFQLIDGKIVSNKIVNEKLVPNLPFIYLGFEYYGNKTLIKSTNLSKFYRRMIYSVKKKCNRAKKVAERDGVKPVIFKRQLYKIYRNINLDKSTSIRKFSTFIKLETGESRLKSKINKKPFQGNYFSYAKRAAEIMNEPAILNQIKGERRVFNQSIQKHLKS